MTVNDEIMDLQSKAVRWTLEPDSKEKVMFAFWLNGELMRLSDIGIPSDSEVDFRATVKIMLEELLPTPIGNE